jgi:hypothetical protein
MTTNMLIFIYRPLHLPLSWLLFYFLSIYFSLSPSLSAAIVSPAYFSISASQITTNTIGAIKSQWA